MRINDITKDFFENKMPGSKLVVEYDDAYYKPKGIVDFVGSVFIASGLIMPLMAPLGLFIIVSNRKTCKKLIGKPDMLEYHSYDVYVRLK